MIQEELARLTRELQQLSQANATMQRRLELQAERPKDGKSENTANSVLFRKARTLPRLHTNSLVCMCASLSSPLCPAGEDSTPRRADAAHQPHRSTPRTAPHTGPSLCAEAMC